MADKTFTEKQREVVARKMGYEGPMNMFDEYLKSSPADSQTYAMIGSKFMAKGGSVSKKKPRLKFADGGSVPSFTDAQVASYFQNNATTPAAQQEAMAIFGVSPAQAAAANALIASNDASIGQASAAYNASVASNPNAAAENAAFVASQQAALAAGQPTYAQTVAGGGTTTATTPTGGGTTTTTAAPAIPSFSDAAVASYLSTQKITTPEQLAQVQAIFNVTPAQVARAQQLLAANDPSVAQATADYNKAIAANPSQVAANEKAIADRMKELGLTPIVPIKPIVPILPVTPAPTTPTTTAAGQQLPPPVAPGAANVTPSLVASSADQLINTQLAPEQAAAVTAAPVGQTATAATPTATPAALAQATMAAPAVQAATAGLQPAQGTVSQQAQVQAAQAVPGATAVADLQAAQGVANQITNVPQRVLVDGELVQGTTVDQAKVDAALQQTQASAAQGVVTDEMTVQGQLNKLYTDFETGNPPAWAAASLRNANAVLAARGVGASSLAGQAIVQAALEAAMPIAAADAATFTQMGLTNLSNRQQMAVLTGQQRAQFLGQEFDQAFQTKVLNAAKISDIANANFGAEIQVTLENARLAQTMDLANLSNRQAMVVATAAQIANLEMANLSNTQQARVLNAQSFLQMDMANLANEQQTELFKTQTNVQAILSDNAVANATAQFNATSQNQTTQFFSQLISQAEQFNASQTNSMEQFNVSQLNGIAQFNASAQNLRDQFNAQNRLVIDQSNAQWRREIATANTAAINRSNEFNATKAQEINTISYNNQWQQFRDELEYSWRSAESAAERTNRIAIAEISANASILTATAAKDAKLTETIAASAVGILKGTDVGGVAKSLISTISDLGSNVYDSLVTAYDKLFSSDTYTFDYIQTPGYQAPNVEE